MKILFLDTETGGLTSDVSVLSISLTLTNFEETKIKKIGGLSLNCRPDDGAYTIFPEALAVNKIDLQEHRANSVTYSTAGRKIYAFLREVYTQDLQKPLLCGQNIQFDLEHTFRVGIISRDSFFNYVDKRILDTLTISQFAVFCGLIPKGNSLSLNKLASYLGVEANKEQLHNAEYDNIVTAKILLKLRNLFMSTSKDVLSKSL